MTGDTMDTKMPAELLTQLCERHVAYTMAQLQPENLLGHLKAELAQGYLWLDAITLSELVDRQLIKDIGIRLLQNSPYTSQLHEMLVKGILEAVNAEANSGTTLTDIVPKSEFDAMVSHLAQFEKLRMDVIKAVLASPLYSRLISDVLYHGIKDYVMSDNMIAKKVPGVSSLMKMGAKTVNKAMPNIEAAAESTLKRYIESNINRTLTLSEKILNNSLDADNIKKVADHFWTAVADKEFAEAARYVKEEDVDRGVEMARNLWQEIRKTEYLQNLVAFVVDHVFDEYGGRKVKENLEALGFDEAYVLGELSQAVPNMVGNPSVQQFIAARVRSQLEAFYQSQDALSVM